MANFSNHKDDDGQQTPFVSFGQFDLSAESLSEPNLDDLPLIATRNLVLFPGVTAPVALVREESASIAEEAHRQHIPIGIVCQMDPSTDRPKIPADLHKYGVVADVLQVIKLPDNTLTAIVRARGRFRILGRGAGETIEGCASAVRVRMLADVPVDEKDEKEYDIVVENVRNLALDLLHGSADEGQFPFDISELKDASMLVNVISSLFPIKVDDKISLLKNSREFDRAFLLYGLLTGAKDRAEIARSIADRARQNMSEQQRNAFLQQQMDVIRDELYGSEADDAEQLAERANNTAFPEAVRATFDRELDKLRRLNPSIADYSVQYTYLDTLLNLPWGLFTELTADFASAEAQLEADHYGLEKVKERILEQLAVMIHKPDGTAPIICLVGAPGVGKTSLGKSIAAALGRNYQRVSLGGLHDEAEIRGHRRTYIGALPGRIIDAMRRAGSANPVILLDEVDKIGADFKGDPAAALLEVLDPEQNCRFHDNYVDVDFDLSKVLFIATANSLSTVARPLLDRMEIIEISGYLAEEKIEIARRHLIPRILEKNDIKPEQLSFTDATIRHIIENYTSESGVRQLDKSLASVARKVLLQKMRGKLDWPYEVVPEQIRTLLGPERNFPDRYEDNDHAGVVTGLAWTEAGGQILFVESSLSKGKGEKLTLTGQLGDVMKESAAIAYQYVKANAENLNINPELFNEYNLHIHLPEGAIPKDGPSAGITMVVSIVSAFRRVKVAPRIAMTGEATLRGRVLPVGGIKEKILAAKRAGITDIILPEDNRRDVTDIPERYLTGLNFYYVRTIPEALRIALTDEPANN